MDAKPLTNGIERASFGAFGMLTRQCRSICGKAGAAEDARRRRWAPGRSAPAARLAILAVCAVFLACTAGTPAGAAVLSQHQGATDPATEGFSQLPEGSGSYFAVPSDGGVPAQGIQTPPGGLNQYLWHAQYTAAQQADLAASGWVMSMNSRVVSNAGSGNADVFLDAANSRYDIVIMLNASGDTVVTLPNTITFNGSTSYGGASTLVTGNGYHLYQLEFDPTAAAADLYVDGTRRLTGYTGTSDFFQPNFGLLWDAIDGTQANFNQVQLSTGVPEPGALPLVALAAVVAGALSRTRRPMNRIRTEEARPR